MREDVTVTILAGNTDDKLSQERWGAFVARLRKVIEGYAEETHFFGGSETYAAWQNVCWVCVFSEKNLRIVEDIVTDIRKAHQQDSVAVCTGAVRFI